MADIFLSYAREDKARAVQVAQALERDGFDVFWDNEIPPGQTWADYIASKLSACRVVVVLWSEASVKSFYVKEEAREGRNHGKLIPAMLDGSPAPFGFGEVQAADLSQWNGAAGHEGWTKLAAALRAALADVGGEPVRPGDPAGAGATGPSAGSAAGAGAAAAPAIAVQKTITVTPAAETPRGHPLLNPFVLIGGGLAVVVLLVTLLVRSMAPAAAPQAMAAPGAVAAPQAAMAPQAPQAAAPVQNNPAEMAQRAGDLATQLQQATTLFAQSGFQSFGQPFANMLAPNAPPMSVPVTLQAGVTYQILGVCDNFCDDLDLRLIDQNGIQVGLDVAPDDHPVVYVTPRETAQFQLQVHMAQCRAAQCAFAAQLYTR